MNPFHSCKKPADHSAGFFFLAWLIQAGDYDKIG
jgi:hypothetical protein